MSLTLGIASPGAAQPGNSTHGPELATGRHFGDGLPLCRPVLAQAFDAAVDPAGGVSDVTIDRSDPATRAPARDGTAQDLQAALQLRSETRLREDLAARTDGRPTYVRADRMEGRAGHDATLTGDAQLRRAGTVLTADRITFYEADQEVFAAGTVRVNRAGSLFEGPQLQLKLDTNTGHFLAPSYYMPEYNGRGRAAEIEFLGPRKVRMTEATYTTCDPQSVDWVLEGRSLTLDEDAGMGTGRSARLMFFGVRSPPLPFFAFPMGDERKSGFLPPTLSINSRTGVDVVVPYYWNIAPNRDFTLYPRLMTKRGVQIGGEYRYLERRYRGDVSFEWNPNDQSTGGSRYFYALRHGFTGLGGWSGGWNVRGVSDDDYFVDYSRSIVTAADRILPRHFYAARSLGSGWTFQFDIQRWQSILDARPGPYERVPQLRMHQLKRDVAGFDIDTVIEATQFVAPTPTMPEGWRAFVNPQVSWPMIRPGWSIVPKVSLHASRYQLDRNARFETELNRVVPTYSIDAGMVFERPASFFGRSMLQTLEPRLFYVRTPYRDQTQFPVFDSAVVDMSFAQLFSENTFVGHDRIADVNQITGGLVSRLIDPSTGAEHLRLAVAQRIYFSDQQVSLPGVEPITDGRSDLLLGASGDLGRGMRFDTAMQYSMQDSRVPRFGAQWTWRPEAGQVLNLGARYRRDQIGQLDASWRWNHGGRWTTMGRFNYSFLDRGVDPISLIPNTKGMVQTVLGFEYDACCWISRIVMQRYATAVDTFTTGLFLQLELKGLGRIGSNPFDILRQNIPGFSQPLTSSGTSSPYFGYE